MFVEIYIILNNHKLMINNSNHVLDIFQDTPVQQQHDFQSRTTTIKKTKFDQHQTARKQQQQPILKQKMLLNYGIIYKIEITMFIIG